ASSCVDPGLVAGVTLGMLHLYDVDGLIFLRQYGSDHRSRASLALSILLKSSSSRNSPLHTKECALHRVFCLLCVDLSLVALRHDRLAFDMGFGRTLHCSGIFGAG